jgi:glycosyltransferase involved in cell wall biosynthesis
MQNLEDNFVDNTHIEFVLVDFGSTDGFRDWIRFQNFKKYNEHGYFKYYETDRLNSWHASVAKNTAIHYSTGKIVVTLDCDNFTGIRGGDFVINQFEKHNYNCVLHQFDQTAQNGNFGRIGLTKNKFNQLGGYDQSLLPMGYQDWDLLKRAESTGSKYINMMDDKYNKAILNSGGKKLSIANTQTQHKALGWTEMNRINKLKSQHNIYREQFIANKGYYGLRADVRRIF